MITADDIVKRLEDWTDEREPVIYMGLVSFTMMAAHAVTMPDVPANNELINCGTILGHTVVKVLEEDHHFNIAPRCS